MALETKSKNKSRLEFKKMTLGEYIKRRNGVAIGHPQSLKNNLSRSLGAKNFSSFWHYWNPIFGYYLGKKIFKPAKRFAPATISLMVTFVFCGLIHDIVSVIFRGQTSFLFSCWFLFMGSAVLLSNYFKHNLSHKNWANRALTNLFVILSCLCLAYYLVAFLNLSFKIY